MADAFESVDWAGSESWNVDTEQDVLPCGIYVDPNVVITTFREGDAVGAQWFRESVRAWGWSLPRRAKLTPERKRELDVHGMAPEIRVALGREVVAGFGLMWSRRHAGQFVAVSLRRRSLLASHKTLEGLYDVLAVVNPDEDFFVTQVGADSIGVLR